MGFAFLFLNCNIRFGFCNFTLDKTLLKLNHKNSNND